MPEVVGSSFRDPSGFLFWRDGTLYRQVNHEYREHLELLWSSGLYERLVERGLLVRHEDAPLSLKYSESAYRVLAPERVPFVSYPYEWCASQLRDAALLTLEVQELAFEHGMTLKDASAYNVQFLRGNPVFIDLLSFEKYVEGTPWIPFRQFCQHFVAPLLLARYIDPSLTRLARIYLDGIPLSLAAAMLPARSRLSPLALVHVHLHAAAQRRASTPSASRQSRRMSGLALRGLVDSLKRGVASIRPRLTKSSWSHYYDDCLYSTSELQAKEEMILEYLRRAKPTSVWDLGANTGRFGFVAARAGIPTIAFDLDDAAVERCYRRCRSEGESNLLPLVLDLTNPSPGLGWASRERLSLAERGPASVVLALALIHHLAIGNNVPLPQVLGYFAELGHFAIVEFVPKSDPQAQKLLAAREDIFAEYSREHFEAAAGACSRVLECREILSSGRILYLLEFDRD